MQKNLQTIPNKQTKTPKTNCIHTNKQTRGKNKQKTPQREEKDALTFGVQGEATNRRVLVNLQNTLKANLNTIMIV